MSEKIRFSFGLTAFSAGIAIFSMFFGAGNVIFPLNLGKTIGEPIAFALAGVVIMGIGGPLLGLISTILFDGDCKKFFNRIGEVPAYLIVILILAIIGPFGAMPRCFTVAHSAITPYVPIDLFLFSLLSGALVLFCVYKRDLIIPILGMILSPILLGSLCIIIVRGFMLSTAPVPTDYTPMSAFAEGIHVGYDMMDLLASMFFAVIIWDLLKEKFAAQGRDVTPKSLAPVCFTAAIIGGLLLGVIYVGLSLATAQNMQVVADVPQQALLTKMAIYILGDFSFIANVALALACLTTVISLAATVADVIIVEFRDSRVGNGRELNYHWLVVGIVLITVLFSNLGFDTLMKFLHPIVSICYPAIIVLAICNILYKLVNFPFVKLPVYATFLISLSMHVYTHVLLEWFPSLQPLEVYIG